MVENESEECPCQGEYGDYEQDQYEDWRELVVLVEAVDEPREHADDWDQGDNLHDAPSGEENAWNHLGRSLWRLTATPRWVAREGRIVATIESVMVYGGAVDILEL